MPSNLRFASVFDLVELAEDVVEVLGRDADAGILDRDMQLLAARLGLDPHDADQHMARLR